MIGPKDAPRLNALGAGQTGTTRKARRAREGPARPEGQWRRIAPDYFLSPDSALAFAVPLGEPFSAVAAGAAGVAEPWGATAADFSFMRLADLAAVLLALWS